MGEIVDGWIARAREEVRDVRAAAKSKLANRVSGRKAKKRLPASCISTKTIPIQPHGNIQASTRLHLHNLDCW